MLSSTVISLKLRIRVFSLMSQHRACVHYNSIFRFWLLSNALGVCSRNSAAQESSAILHSPTCGEGRAAQGTQPFPGAAMETPVPSSHTAPHPSQPTTPPRRTLPARGLVCFHIYLRTKPISSYLRHLSKEFSRMHICEVKHKCEYTYTVIITSPQRPQNTAAYMEKLLADLTHAFFKNPNSL